MNGNNTISTKADRQASIWIVVNSAAVRNLMATAITGISTVLPSIAKLPMRGRGARMLDVWLGGVKVPFAKSGRGRALAPATTHQKVPFRNPAAVVAGLHSRFSVQ